MNRQLSIPVEVRVSSSTTTFLSKRYRPVAAPTSKNDYDLSCPIDPEWEHRSQRVLLVIETIDGQDLLEGRLLHHRSKTVVSNLIQYSMVQAKVECDFRRKDCAFATLNFNNYKFFDQNVETWPGHRKRMAKRVLEVIEDLKPTMVIVFGDYAMKTLVKGEEFLEKKRGWVFDLQAGDWKTKIVGTLDLYPLYSSRKEGDAVDEDDEDEAEGDVFGKANLLFYVSRNIINALAGRNIYDLSYIRPKPKVIDTLEKFKVFYKKLLLAPIVAVDTETRNGSVNHNAIHTIQFAFGTARGYLIPIDHPQTPFDAEEIAYIKKKLRRFFYAKPGKFPVKYLIMQYGIFDLRVLRVELGIPVIFHPVWEIMAGEWCFHPDTWVETELGRKQIKDIVARYPDIRVWSFNFETGKPELKKLINRSERNTEEDLIHIEYEGGSISVTANHKIWSNTRKAYVRADEIEEGEDLELFANSVESLIQAHQ